MKNLYKYILSLSMLMVFVCSINAQNNPYVDDKLIHFGFSLGMDLYRFFIILFLLINHPFYSLHITISAMTNDRMCTNIC